MRDESSSNAEHFGEMDLDELAEATAVVVASRLRIAKCFQQRICYQNQTENSKRLQNECYTVTKDMLYIYIDKTK